MADNIMSFEDYLELIKRLRLDGLDKSKVDQATDKVLKVLDEFAPPKMVRQRQMLDMTFWMLQQICRILRLIPRLWIC